MSWKIKHIFDGDYGCEERLSGEGLKVSVTLVNESGEEKRITVEDAWLTENGLDVGSGWPRMPSKSENLIKAVRVAGAEITKSERK